MKILISTIIRNQIKQLDTWYVCIRQLIQLDKDNEYFLSVYQNDSTDGTKEKIKDYDFSFVQHDIKSQNIDTKYANRFTTTQILDINTTKIYDPLLQLRLRNLSTARNCTLQNLDKKEFDKVLIIQSDISYIPKIMVKFLKFSLNQEYDIISPISIMYEELYDKWATRLYEGDVWFVENQQYKSNTLVKCYSTFNCFCLYQSKPFYQGIRFSALNLKGQYDCDTVNICELFRNKGYDKIYLDKRFFVNGR